MINVTLNTKTRQCVPDNKLLGFEEDNNSNKIIFKFDDGFVDGLARLYIRKGDKKGMIELTKQDENYVLPVKKSLFIGAGYIEFQLTIYRDEDIVASYEAFELIAKEKIITDDEIPEELPSWIDDYNAKIIEIEMAIGNAEKATENANNVASDLILAKENGEFKGEKGDKGDKGDAGSVKFIVVAELPIENIDESAIYMKALVDSEEQNKYEEYIYVNGQWESLGIAQVEVNLDEYAKQSELESLKEYTNILAENVTSLAIQRVSFTDFATEERAGVIKAWTSTNEDGEIGLNISTEV